MTKKGLIGAAALLCLASPLASAEVAQKGTLRVIVSGELNPRLLPRSEVAPVAVSFAGRIATTEETAPPQLRAISIAINRHGHLFHRGLPICHIGEISPASNREAIAACRSSLVGEGRFSSSVRLPEQSPFPSQGKVLAFNGFLHGKPAILAHIYGTNPAPTSIVLPFRIGTSTGAYGTVLEAFLPRATGDWGYVTGISMTLHRRFSVHGQRRSFISADCPAPPGFPGAVFPLARTSFAFANGKTLTSVLQRTCKVKR
jgi:hypothetical protein